MLDWLIAGGGLGIGAIAALWFYAKFVKADGDLRVKAGQLIAATADIAKLNGEVSKLNEEKAILIKNNNEALARKDDQIAVHKNNEDVLRKIIEDGKIQALIDAANRVHRPIGT